MIFLSFLFIFIFEIFFLFLPMAIDTRDYSSYSKLKFWIFKTYYKYIELLYNLFFLILFKINNLNFAIFVI